MFESHDEHVLGQPAFLLCQGRPNAESQTLLAEERVAAVAGSEREDVAGGWDVSDQDLLRVAGPGNVFLARCQGLAARVKTSTKKKKIVLAFVKKTH